MPILLAIFAIALGAVFCFVGYRFFRILLPIFGFFAGLWAGVAGLQAIFGPGFLAGVTGIVVGVVLGIILAVLSYLIWYVGVAIFGGFVGYWLLTAIWQGLFGTAGFVAVILGIVVGIIFFLLFLFLNVQKYLVIVITALGGAGVLISGVWLLFNPSELAANHLSFVAPIISKQSPWWTLIWIVLLVAGIVVQIRASRDYTLDTTGRAW